MWILALTAIQTAAADEAAPTEAEIRALFQGLYEDNRDYSDVIQRRQDAPFIRGEREDSLLTVSRQGDLVVMQDEDGEWLTEAMSQVTSGGFDWLLGSIYDAFYTVESDEYQYLNVMLVRDLGLFFAFYSPMANDVSGIGYNLFTYGGGQTFDNTPDSQIEGFIFMNYVGLWAENPEVGCWVFNQEFGHRWGAFVDVDVEGVDMLGRDDAHWSYWLDIGNSPLEGNDWVSNGDGSYTVDYASAGDFSDLDMYLMGFIGADEVADMDYLEVSSPEQSQLDRSEASSPEHFNYLYGYDMDEITTYANPVTVTIDDVVEANGERSPAVGESPTDFKMAYIIIALEGDPVDEDTLAMVNEVRLGWEDCWSGATRGISNLDSSLSADGAVDTGGDTGGTASGDDTGGSDGASGDDADDVEVAGAGCGCASGPAPAGGLLGLALAGLIGWRRRER